MHEQYRALVVILILATGVFAFARAPATAIAIQVDDYSRRRHCWFLVTLAGFLSPNFWIFLIVVGLLLIHAAKREHNGVALFLFILLALPKIGVEIPGFGGIRYFFEIDYVRLLSILVLLPIFISLRRRSHQKEKNSFSAPDMLLASYIVLNLVLAVQVSSLTEVLRSLLYWFVDAILPYYVISRSIKDMRMFRDALMSLIVGGLIVSLVGIFEFSKHWLLYSSLGEALGVDWSVDFLGRGEFLRSMATSGQPIVLGYVVAINIGFFLFLKQSIPSWPIYLAGLAILIAGEIAPLSRGPWIGSIAIVFVFFGLGPNRLSRIAKMCTFLLPIIILLLLTDWGNRIVAFLPFVGSIEEGNITYRQQLFDTALNIILDNPFFGSTDFLIHMENLRQGQGIIDLVNTFLIIALNTGLIGLVLFVSFFGIVMIGIIKRMKRLRSDSDEFVLGRSLLAVSIGILVIIATVSPITHVPIFYWSVAAMGVAYSDIIVNLKNTTNFRAPPRLTLDYSRLHLEIIPTRISLPMECTSC